MSSLNSLSTCSNLAANLNAGMLLELNSSAELSHNTRIYEKRYSFSARNFIANNNTQVFDASISPEISCFENKEQKQYFKSKLSKNLICVTDGSSTSFRILNRTETAPQNNHNELITQQTNVTSPKCVSFSRRHILNYGQEHEQITTKYVNSANYQYLR